MHFQCYSTELRELFVDRNINFFGSLKSLTLDDNMKLIDHTFYKILSASKQLKELRIENPNWKGDKTALELMAENQLEVFHFTGKISGIKTCPVKSVKELSVVMKKFDLDFLKHFPNVERLKITTQAKYISHQARPLIDLENLTALTLEFQEISEKQLFLFLSALAEADILTELTLKIACLKNTKLSESPKIIDALCKMTNLEMLHLDTECYCNQDLLRLATLPDLHKLYIFLTIADQHYIKSFVCEFSAMTTNSLQIHVDGNGMFDRNFRNELSEEIALVRKQKNKMELPFYAYIWIY